MVAKGCGYGHRDDAFRLHVSTWGFTPRWEITPWMHGRAGSLLPTSPFGATEWSRNLTTVKSEKGKYKFCLPLHFTVCTFLRSAQGTVSESVSPDPVPSSVPEPVEGPNYERRTRRNPM